MEKILNIDLTPYRGINSTSLTGRPQGKDVRQELKLDTKEESHDKILVHIPLGTTSFNPSFFLGLFYNSIKKLGSIEKFEEKFIFVFNKNESEILKEIISDNIDEALTYAKNSLRDSKKGFGF
ncbi:hypothetical protein BWZ20_09120 [Winogradskyella sp. J14-2]|uniref:hypothetical protein n=1 Tax=Winogradskyella sp. J14-2 TaxID=1936080 RepID=UPI0009726A31|nr:hypothetical protein [Winogradskyella sp. J14-2]APY08446.1 hypothetical protein BWZ20_09120 [Winogradskyella sp. J14-2]